MTTFAHRRSAHARLTPVVSATVAFQYPRNHVPGTTFAPASSYALAPPAPTYLPGDVADPHPLNHLAGRPY